MATNELIVITGEENIAKARLIALWHRLKLEMKGFKCRGPSTQSILKREFGFRGNGAKVKEQFKAHLDSIGVKVTN